MKAPKAPDPYATAQAQAQMNKETAISQAGLNAMNQYTADGNLEYNQNGAWADGTPRFSVTQTLSPTNQKLFDLDGQTSINLGQIGVDQSKRMGELLANPMSFDGIGAAPRASDYKLNDYDYRTDASVFNVPAYAHTTDASAFRTDASPYEVDASTFLTNPTAPQARYAPDATLVNAQAIDSNRALEGQLIDLGRRRLDPALAQRRDDAETLLANKGLTVGSTGYTRAMGDVAQAENDAYNNLILTGQGQAFDQAATRANTTFGQDITRFGQFFDQGIAKAQNDFGQDMTRANYTKDVNAQNFGMVSGAAGQNFGQNLAANGQNFTQALSANGQNYGQMASALGQNYNQFAGASAQNFGQMATALNSNYSNEMRGRQQSIDELMALRQAPINELSALMSGSQVSKPTWTSTPQTQIQPTDLISLVNNNYNAKMQGYSGMLSGIGSLAGNILGFGLSKSDVRLKTDIKLVGKLDNGLNVYSYRFKAGGPIHIGVMAQEVAETRPEAVHVMPDGYLAVDYAMATEAA